MVAVLRLSGVEYEGIIDESQTFFAGYNSNGDRIGYDVSGLECQDRRYSAKGYILAGIERTYCAQYSRSRVDSYSRGF